MGCKDDNVANTSDYMKKLKKSNESGRLESVNFTFFCHCASAQQEILQRKVSKNKLSYITFLSSLHSFIVLQQFLKRCKFVYIILTKTITIFHLINHCIALFQYKIHVSGWGLRANFELRKGVPLKKRLKGANLAGEFC